MAIDPFIFLFISLLKKYSYSRIVAFILEWKMKSMIVKRREKELCDFSACWEFTNFLYPLIEFLFSI